MSNAKSSTIKGTGVGLHLTNELVRHHGGRIEVKSVLSEGSTFTVVLPRYQAGVHGITRALFVSKDVTLAPFVEYLLRTDGYSVRHDSDASHATERVRLEHTDTVLVDCDTMGASIEEIVRAGLALSTPSKLIAIGGSSHEDERWSSVIPRPFLSEDLLGAVRRAKLELVPV